MVIHNDWVKLSKEKNSIPAQWNEFSLPLIN